MGASGPKVTVPAACAFLSSVTKNLTEANRPAARKRKTSATHTKKNLKESIKGKKKEEDKNIKNKKGEIRKRGSNRRRRPPLLRGESTGKEGRGGGKG